METFNTSDLRRWYNQMGEHLDSLERIVNSRASGMERQIERERSRIRDLLVMMSKKVE